MRIVFLSCLTLTLLLPVGVAADDYFVPLVPHLLDTQGFDLTSFVTITNGTDEKVEYTTCFRELNVDGTGNCKAKDAGPEDGSLKAGETSGFQPLGGNGFVGMLQIQTVEGALTASGQLFANPIGAAISPSAVGDIAGEVAVLPVISPRNSFAADEEVNLAAWFGPSAKAPWGHYVINTSAEVAKCVATAFDLKGKKRKKRSFKVQPFAMSDAPLKGPWRFKVSCDQNFYPFAWDFVVGAEAGPSVVVALPTELLEKGLPSLATLGREGTCVLDQSDPKVWCKNDFKAIPYTPTNSQRDLVIKVNPPIGEYCRVVINLDIYHGGWKSASGFHELMYYTQKLHRDLIVFAGVQPPPGGDLIVRHGYGLAHVDKPKIRVAHSMKEGEIYHVTYNYNPCNKRVQMEIEDTDGRLVAFGTGVPVQPTPVASLANNFFILAFSKDEPSNPEGEPTTFGWIYANVALEMVKK